MSKGTVSDHALVRYMERVLGFDFNGVRQRILTDDVQTAMEVGACTYPCHDDARFRLVMEDFVVKSVVPMSGPRGVKARKRAREGTL